MIDQRLEYKQENVIFIMSDYAWRFAYLASQIVDKSMNPNS